MGWEVNLSESLTSFLLYRRHVFSWHFFQSSIYSLGNSNVKSVFSSCFFFCGETSFHGRFLRVPPRGCPVGESSSHPARSPQRWWRITRSWRPLPRRTEKTSIFLRFGSVVDLIIWLVVLNIVYFHPYSGKIPNLTNMFQRGWNHQLVMWWARDTKNMLCFCFVGLEMLGIWRN